ncbi:MAG: peptidylprolyl isomerase [Bdellovibrionia bacterium]
MKAQIVSFKCVLKNKLGQVLSSSFNKDVINQIEEDNSGDNSTRLRGLVAGIQNVREGEKREFTVNAHEAYGPYNPDLVVSVPRSELQKGDSLVIGSEIMGRSDRNNSALIYRVTQIIGDVLVLDANHPLAGHDLTFDIEVISARDACSEDFEQPVIAASSQYVH